MRNTDREELDLLAARLPRMSRMAADAMDLAGLALAEADAELADDAVDAGDLLGRACAEGEDRLAALATADLHGVRSTILALNDLERMGRLAVHVADAVRRRHPGPAVPRVLAPRFAEMGRIAVWLATMAGQVLDTGDLSLARTVTRVDADMDDLHRTLFTVLGYQDWAHGTAAAVDVALLSHNYERFGDHAVSLVRRATSGLTECPAVRRQVVDVRIA